MNQAFVLIVATLLPGPTAPIGSPQARDALQRLSVSCRGGMYVAKDMVRVSLAMTFHRSDHIVSQMPLRCPGMKIEFPRELQSSIEQEAETKFTENAVVVHLKADIIGKIYWSNQSQSPALRVTRIMKKGPWFFQRIEIGVGNHD